MMKSWKKPVFRLKRCWNWQNRRKNIVYYKNPVKNVFSQDFLGEIGKSYHRNENKI